ncbi:MAG TPA: DUF1501 domain-containing protein [Gemmataceae bacterium]|nr:DUF1501 domain-containing protein [Gemmataceae bacterium]
MFPAAWSGLFTRRDALRVGVAGIAAAALPVAGIARTLPTKAKSVIVLWMAGGVTHHDSFDPKPDAPEQIRGSLTTIQTALPGIRFTEVMPNMARVAADIALIRTYASGNDDHLLSQAAQLSGRKVTQAQIMTEPNLGSILTKMHGPRAGFPGYIAVPGTTRPGPPPYNLFVGGWLGREYAPFCTGGAPRNDDFTAQVKESPEDEFHKQGLSHLPGMDTPRYDARRSLREHLEDELRRVEKAPDPIAANYRRAFDMLLAPAVRRAFELAEESERLRERYGRTKVGTRCLLARRLVEAGARFVLVDYGYDPEYGNLWDNHNAPTQNFPHICEMAKRPSHLAGVDRAFAALLTDLKARGLLDETLVVFLTEFGRTPKINKEGGRDHWGTAGSIFYAGAGVKVGQVIGTTDKNGAFPVTPAYGPGDVAATIYTALGVDLGTVLHDRQGRAIPMLPEGAPIPGVL